MRPVLMIDLPSLGALFQGVFSYRGMWYTTRRKRNAIAFFENLPKPAETVIRGRGVEKTTGKPLKGVVLTLSGPRTNSQVEALHGKPDWKPPSPLTTGPDGRFELRVVAHPMLRFILEVACEGCVPRTAHWSRLTPNQIVDMGDIALAKGYRVSGKIVDSDGRPVAGVRVRLTGLPLRIGDRGSGSSVSSKQTGADGAFVIR